MELEASASFSIGDKIDEVAGKLHDGMRRPRALFFTFGAAAAGKGSIIVLPIGRPPVGSMWELDNITTYGNDDHTRVTTFTAGCYAGADGTPSLSHLLIPGLQFPDTEEFPRNLYLSPSETLFLLTSDVVPIGQQIGVNVRLREWLQSDIDRGAARR